MKQLCVLTLLVMLSACSTMQTPAADTDAAIRRMDADFAAAVNRADVAAVAGFYADDAILLPPNAPPVRGKAAIQQFWSAFLGSANFRLTLTPENILPSCDMATDVGHYELTITPKGGGASAQDSGKSLVTWKNAGGTWRVAVDMFSSNNPAR